jgi:putative NADH-flavin reductase
MVLRLFLLYAIVLAVALRLKGLDASRLGGVRLQGDGARETAAPVGMRVLIIGATGGTGRQLVAQALERGHEVTALVRNPGALDITHPHLRVVRGDVLDAASIDEAARGQDAVLSALGHKKLFPPNRILSDGTRNMLRAMEAHGVSRFVCETALGIGDATGRMGLYYTLFVIPVILPGYFWDKTRQELLIAESRLSWILVRPGALTNGERREKYRHGQKIGSFFQTVRISRADVAHFMLNQLTDDTYLRAAPGVCW